MSYSPSSGSRIASALDVTLNSLTNNQVLTYDSTGAKWKNLAPQYTTPVTGIPVTDLEQSLQDQLATGGNAIGGINANQFAGYSQLNNVPLGAAAVFRSAPIATTGYIRVHFLITADQTFTAKIDTSTDGTTFTAGTASYPVVTILEGFYCLIGVDSTVPYFRLSLTAGATAMTRLSAEALGVNLLAALVATS